MTDQSTRLVVLGALVLVTVVLGALWRARQGRVRVAPARRDLAVDWAARGIGLGDRATFVQLSAEVCAPCRATARVLRGLAERESGVVHHELDVEEHLDLVRELGVLKTPTVLVLDAAGAQAARSSGGMSPAQARQALDATVPAG
ncbi:thioredoxin family protein [Krasilnikoviella flava]|uniref:Thioredoxin n=1 Tax=Krasilnikoviella flava TaxID=526729 RepID=A0A1T5L7M4_9MICO|nr:thioredoxin family protein [Krasilnikoviella flava]SKC71934.1 Thioredoxin [Krasilnikoviella flava]